MSSNKLTTSFQYSSNFVFFLNIVTYFALSKQIWIVYDQLFLEFPYEGKSLSASLQHRRPTSYLHKEILRRKNLNFGPSVFIFALLIRNKSLFSGQILTFFKIERMSLNLSAIWSSHKIEMQIIYDDRKLQASELVFQGLNIGKSSTGIHFDGVAVVENVKTILC